MSDSVLIREGTMNNSISKSAIFLIPFFIFLLSSDLFSQEIKVRVIKPNARIMVQPNSESLEIQKIPLGAILNVEETIGEWIKVVLPESDSGLIIKGYIHSKFVEYEVKRFQLKDQEKERVGTLTTPEKSKPSVVPSDYQYDDYFSWNRSLELAKGKKSTGDALSWLGAGISILGSIFYAIDTEENSHYLYYGLGGLGLSIIGFAVSAPAAQEIRILELEGARKGYIVAGLSPTIYGAVFRLKYAF